MILWSEEPIRGLQTLLGDATVVFVPITHAGSAFVAAAVVLALYLYDERAFLACAVAGVCALATVHAAKSALSMPRPPPGVRLVYTPTENGFPSGHVAGTTAVYTTLAYVSSDSRRRLVAYMSAVSVFVSLIALSRVVLGVHYVADVIGGAAVGLAVFGVVAAARTERRLLALVTAVPLVAVAAEPSWTTAGALALAVVVVALSRRQALARRPTP